MRAVFLSSLVGAVEFFAMGKEVKAKAGAALQLSGFHNLPLS